MLRIYLTDLASYNNGNLVGEWLELPRTDLDSDIKRIMERGSLIDGYGEEHEEYFITDYECDFYSIGEYESLNTLNDLADKMSNLDTDQQTAVKIMMENYIVDGIDQAIECLEDIYNTGETDMESIAYNYVQETGTLENMGRLSYYFNYESLASDMELNGTYLEDDEGYLWEYVA